MSVTASIVIEFGSDILLEAELDDDLNGDSSSFTVQDSIYFRVYTDADPDDYSVECSSGTVQRTAIGNIPTSTIKENVSFTKAATADLSKYVEQLVGYTWYPASAELVYGAVERVNRKTVRCANGATLGADNILGVARAEYKTKYDIWKYTPPADAQSVFAATIYISAG